MSVCNKIESKKRTTYNEVADELVEELQNAPGESAGDDKNIRRRVYDAFNVLLAVGIITKEGKKEILWRGFPNQGSCASIEAAQAERMRVAEAVEKKQQQLRVRMQRMLTPCVYGDTFVATQPWPLPADACSLGLVGLRTFPGCLQRKGHRPAAPMSALGRGLASDAAL
jgi:hypothetical protein